MINNYMGQMFDEKVNEKDEKKQKLLDNYAGQSRLPPEMIKSISESFSINDDDRNQGNDAKVGSMPEKDQFGQISHQNYLEYKPATEGMFYLQSYLQIHFIKV